MMILTASEWLVLILISLGVALMLISAVGLVRMPDLYLRIAASSKGATLGVICLMLATALYFGELGVTSRALAVICFMLLTAPVAAHMMGRAGYKGGAPYWSQTTIDAQSKLIRK